MRIIAGQRKGFVLAAPKGEATRPTLSRVRESVFSILGAQLIDAQIVDLFAGAGTLGLEALSRGAAHCTFVETARDALVTLRANVENLDYEQQSEIFQQNAITWATSSQFRAQPHVIFADPPYHETLAQKTLEALLSNPQLPPDMLLVLQCGKRDEISHVSGRLSHFRTEKYGETIVHFFTSNP
ncbi:MAG: 16S rRNA (guanine(966)-N(2))-methyltransferase RsmD [Candidatus Sumerlaeaceae bacterium]